ncbi:MAG: protein translocase subunit SecF [Candidatus Vogelbacteria bacterium]|nr:protein translocase subunit SecF [Candidatus Vogelbacteria bacterium]
MSIINHRNIFFTISILAVIASLVVVFAYGLNFGPDFIGGSILEVTYQGTRPDINLIQSQVAGLTIGTVLLQPTEVNGLIARTRVLTNDEKNILERELSFNSQNPITEKRFSAIGPALGQELAHKGVIAIVLVMLLIVIFITFAFWGVSQPVTSWKYGLITLVALIHDVIIPTGVFAYLGHTKGAEVDALFLTALLTILALSVNDTIVVFDRIRENLKNKISNNFEETVGVSLEQTFTRSVNTSVTVILVLLALYFFGGSTTKDFALVLSIGMIVGTYSSIFLASPLLVAWNNWSSKK